MHNGGFVYIFFLGFLFCGLYMLWDYKYNKYFKNICKFAFNHTLYFNYMENTLEKEEWSYFVYTAQLFTNTYCLFLMCLLSFYIVVCFGVWGCFGVCGFFL